MVMEENLFTEEHLVTDVDALEVLTEVHEGKIELRSLGGTRVLATVESAEDFQKRKHFFRIKIRRYPQGLSATLKPSLKLD